MEDSPRYDTGGAQAEMPRYISCQQIWALKIARIEEDNLGGHALVFEDPRYAPRHVGPEWVAKRGALPGGYFVVYPDGYTSWKPTDAFRETCTPEHEWGLPRSQETKYRVNLRGKLENRATGKVVTCPVWIVLAKDTRALSTVHHYREEVPLGDGATREAMNVVLLQFSDFSHKHPNDMKPGDTKYPAPPVPRSIASPPRPELDPQKWSPGEREGS